MDIKFPAKLVFKLISFAPQIYLFDSDGNEVLYVYQRYWKIKEKIDVYSNRKKEEKLFEINADRVIDFSPNFTITDQNGIIVGSIKRHGMKSLWKGYFEISDASGQVVYKITEDNPWVKVWDTLLSQLPIINLFSGLIFHPSYSITRMSDQAPIAKIKKSSSFAERIFGSDIENNDLNSNHKQLIALSMIMIALLERRTG